MVRVYETLRGTAFLSDWAQLVRRDIQQNTGGFGAAPPPTSETGDTSAHAYTHFEKRGLVSFADGRQTHLRRTGVCVTHERGRTDNPDDEAVIVRDLRRQRVAWRNSDTTGVASVSRPSHLPQQPFVDSASQTHCPQELFGAAFVLRHLNPETVLRVPFVEPSTGAPVVYKKTFRIERSAFTEGVAPFSQQPGSTGTFQPR
jgi:hypothetical protein